MSGGWVHQFAPFGEAKQIGEEQVFVETKRPIMAQPMRCVHCGKEYVRNVDPQPIEMCPKRNDKRERKRILNVNGEK